MARQKNDGKGRMGGRGKGTPNKVTTSVKEWISQLIDDNRGQVERDLKALEPKERVLMIEKLMQYVVPKQQAVSTTVDFEKLTDRQLDDIVKSLTNNIDYEANTN